MPVTTPEVKVTPCRALGGEVVLFGDSYSDAYEHSRELQRKRGLVFVHPSTTPTSSPARAPSGWRSSASTTRPSHGPIHAVFAAIGGGGLIAGVGAYVKALRPEIKVIGVQTTDADAMARSLAAGHRVTLQDVGLFSDGTAVRVVGRRDLPRLPRVRRRRADGRQRRAVRRHQGRVPGHALDPRTRRRARRGGREGLRRVEAAAEQDARHDRLRRQHELRSPEVRRRAGGGRRAPRGGVRGDHSRGARVLQVASVR